MKQLRELNAAGQIVDPRPAQIERLTKENAGLKERIAARDTQLAALAEFRAVAISRQAAQHDEIERLRRQIADSANTLQLPTAAGRPAPCGSCS
ncbi:hypothetical protein GR925_33875 [Streptomyces sp. HUCO-GS316]|uniref:hypothetical protein n=1 Tax=Streptomyces sp. HUCO-GS316 TaxID=2692198 RepID=UPI00136D1A96|nr:hypothetical protein [Streptomyces sp. HUCO-GS316]MXM68283.1 hypothetical protein [Streptomyces sp. HUCO-GS316]